MTVTPLDIAIRERIDPRCEECGGARDTRRGDHRCLACGLRADAWFAREAADFASQYRPRGRTVHVVKLPEGMMKRDDASKE